MASAWRIRRHAELLAISNTEPERLIALYRFVTGLVVSTEPPPCVSFKTMIETILDHDAQLTVTEWRDDNTSNSPQVPT
jgi:hypothetical protein